MRSKNFTLRVLKNRQEIQRVQTHSIRLFLRGLRTIKWKCRGIKTYLRVSYGKQVDCFGKLSNFYNDGFYYSKEDLWLAFDAFTEK